MSATIIERPVQSHGGLALLAGAIGNILEWYDFSAYGFFAAIFGRNFFPASNHVVSLLSAFAVFAAAFFMRPLGGLIFGHVADRHDRKTALLISSLMMALSTFLIGCLPTFTSIGVLAPMLLVTLRLVQGLSLGGEYSVSVTFLAEGSQPKRRGLVGSLAPLGATIGSLLGSCLGALISHFVDPAALIVWGWRLPFLFGVVLGGLIFWLRRGQLETAPAPAPAKHDGFPIVAAFRADWRGMLRNFFLSSALLAYFYLVFVYFVTFTQEVDGLSPGSVFAINTSSLVLMAIGIPLCGWLSDIIGRRWLLLAALLLMVVGTWPLFRLFSSHHIELKIFAGQLGFALLLAVFGGPLPATMAESFGATGRCSAIAVSYNLGAAVAGGTAPIIATALVDPQARHPMGPAFYLMIWAVLALVAALTLRKGHGRVLAS